MQSLKYIISDFVAAALAWTLFYLFRKVYIESYLFGSPVNIQFDTAWYLAVATLPATWVLFYASTGFYKNPYRKSRLIELGQTLSTSLLGVTILFFVLILDDVIGPYTNYYASFAVLLGLHFGLTYIPRLLLTSRTIARIRKGKIGFNTAIIGGNGRAMELFDRIRNQQKSYGNIIKGFISVRKGAEYRAAEKMPHLGNINAIQKILRDHQIEEVIIAMESSEQDTIGNVINKLNTQTVQVKAVPGNYDILLGRVKMSTIYGTPLIQITNELIPSWQLNLKQFLDYFLALLALLLASPLILGLALAIKLTSRGPVIYSHERIGRHGKPFHILKFRSMVVDAEKHGPQLSSKNDPRITSVGKFMRKHRLDEIPNFVNVLKGEMSLVGPRPERRYYIEKIIEKAPHYLHLQKVKPGITSWGQIKFGYASNVDEMIERLQYDLIYLENMSLYVDLKIMIYTLITIIKGSGK